MDFSKYGLRVPDTLLPKNEIDWLKWSVIACDQYTSQIKYWDDVEKLVGESPSTLRLIWPEAWLETSLGIHDPNSIKGKMCEYLDMDLFKSVKGFIHTKRTLRSGIIRKGLIANIDLECYEFNPKIKALIKSTEGTIINRLPARIDVREKAELEVTHVMILVDDIDNLLMNTIDNLEKKELYNFELMMDSGHITGYLIDYKDEGLIAKCFDSILEKNRTTTLFGVGDGNHSLAAAKTHWENIKGSLSKDELLSSPARYAMVEIVNLYDMGLEFEPIHRIIKSNNPQLFMDEVIREFKIIGDVSFKPTIDAFHYKYCIDGITSDLYVTCDYSLAITALQEIIDKLSETTLDFELDYIHGEDVVKKLSVKNVLGIILSDFKKSGLFKTIEKGKVLPRKSFSIGLAHEKRFYLECRTIK